ncbi:hypothetical protein ACFOG5_24500 [Pedobacter fastidiosus]|uniref:hypothetical protein n=1 Tax=Pedobacter fastidiosus TaxID=2765361 RepID=UPI0036244259
MKRQKSILFADRRLANDYPYLQAISYFFEADLYLAVDTAKCWKAIHTGDSLFSGFKVKESYLYHSKLWYNAAIMEQDADHTKVVAAFFYQSDPLVKKAATCLHWQNITSCWSHLHE